MAHLMAAIAMTLVNIKVIRRLQAFSSLGCLALRLQ